MLITFEGVRAIMVDARDISARKLSEVQLRAYSVALEDKNRELDFLTNRLINLNRDL